MSIIMTLTGRSGSGKSTIERELVARGLKRAISHTTRNPREGETNGDNYYFITKEEMLKMKDNGELAEFTEYNGNYYGVSYDELNHSNILVIEPYGLRYLKENSKDLIIKSIFIDVDEEELRRRMLTRGDSEESVEKRIEVDRERFDKNSDLYDFIVVNRDLNTVCDGLAELYDSITESGSISLFNI